MKKLSFKVANEVLMAQRSFNSVKLFALEFCRFWRFWLKIFRWNFFAGFDSAKKKNQEKLRRSRNINRQVWTENESLSFLCLLSIKKRMKSVSWRTVLWNGFIVKRLEIMFDSLFLLSKTHLLSWIQQRKNQDKLKRFRNKNYQVYCCSSSLLFFAELIKKRMK
jgi:hypothetical protein